jgi:hypothetical protein
MIALVTPGMGDRERHRQVRHPQAGLFREPDELFDGVEPALVAEAALRANELQRAALLQAHDPNRGDVTETGNPEQRKGDRLDPPTPDSA